MSSEAKKTSMLSYDSFTPQQTAAIERLYEHNTLLVAPKGFGKCAVGQTVCQELLEAGELERILVVAPLKVCQMTWEGEWRYWAHLRKPAMAIGDASHRELVIDSDARLVVINFENLPWLFQKYGDRHGFDGLLVDESTKLKAAGGATFKALRPRLKDFKWRCCMTADAVAEQGTDIYTQAMVIDGGQALGRNKERFQRRYFYPTDYEQRKWAILPGHDVKLAEALKPLLHVVEDVQYEESLPELRDAVVHVEMPAEVWKAYNAMATDMYIDFTERGVEAPNQAVVSGKLLQITSGAVYGLDGNGRRFTSWLHGRKFAALSRILEAADGPVIVAYQFDFELEQLRKETHVVVLGEDPERAQAAWNRGEIPVLAVHPKSAAHGLNLQHGGHELVILSPIWSADQNEQLVGRLRRRGQPSAYVRRTSLVVPGSIDELVLDRVLGKEQDSKALNQHLLAAAQK